MDKLHLSVEVDTNQLDATIEKVNQLNTLLQEAYNLIDSLSISKGHSVSSGMTHNSYSVAKVLL